MGQGSMLSLVHHYSQNKSPLPPSVHPSTPLPAQHNRSQRTISRTYLQPSSIRFPMLHLWCWEQSSIAAQVSIKGFHSRWSIFPVTLCPDQFCPSLMERERSKAKDITSEASNNSFICCISNANCDVIPGEIKRLISTPSVLTSWGAL